MKRLFYFSVLVFISLFVMVSCGKEVEVSSIELSPSSAVLGIGETVSLTATVSPSNATYDGFVWKSSKPQVASVSASEQVTALAEGTTTITVMAGNKTATCDVQVKISVAAVSLDKESLYLAVGVSDTIKATVSPDEATDKSFSWSSSDPSVVTVSSSGVVSANAAGTATVTVTTNDGEKTASCNVTVFVPTMHVPEAIDLGLPSGIKWASFNLGSSKPEEIGDFYAWGEIEPYYISLDPLVWKEGKEAGYTWASYKWCMGKMNTLTKYCPESKYGYNGFTDKKTVLDPEDDAAYMAFGGRWRMPTDTEFTELIFKCTWEETTLNGAVGHLVTGPNGNSIFLPARRMVEADGSPSNSYITWYWTSSVSFSDTVHALDFIDGPVTIWSTSHRFSPLSIRAVIDE